ncbi:ATP-grasp domain-containing protein [Paenibacillus mendelii]|uniref:ATP-grasp domain-containing protein n=1 Tax=Paenibacillus mendelii TaxID=206163 RepID=A0ABV6JD94_9BACL|nr:ATP-grasp domain-containing protein [Paenibacillus mendelii]
MKLLFCSDPLNDRQVDPEYEMEYNMAKELSIPVELVSLESLLEGNSSKAIKRIPTSESQETVIYRGWMMKPAYYEQLYNALTIKNLFLINSPEAYVYGHYFPNSYEVIQAATPLSIWLDIESLHEGLEPIHEKLNVFGSRPIIIKDYVKSRKHEWEEACYIPDASDKHQVQYVVGNLIERQGEELSGGVVFREYIELEHLSKHPKSGMPLE